MSLSGLLDPAGPRPCTGIGIGVPALQGVGGLLLLSAMAVQLVAESVRGSVQGG